MKRRWLGIVLFVAAVFITGWLVSSNLSLASLADRERSVRDLIAEHPLISWVLGFFVYFLISLVPGTRGKAVAGGWLFGFWPGLLLVNCALTLAAIVGFLVSRYLLSDGISSRYSVQLRRIDRALDANGAFYVILLRIVPVSFSLMNYLLGATKLKRRTYWWATHVGLLPGNVVFVNAGAQLPSLHALVNEGWTVLVSWDVIGGILLLSLFALLAPVVVSRWSKRAGG
jgi:uncharacterized membrane protein YdjX (TVP38/TMEM64 family)